MIRILATALTLICICSADSRKETELKLQLTNSENALREAQNEKDKLSIALENLRKTADTRGRKTQASAARAEQEAASLREEASARAASRKIRDDYMLQLADEQKASMEEQKQTTKTILAQLPTESDKHFNLGIQFVIGLIAAISSVFGYLAKRDNNVLKADNAVLRKEIQKVESNTNGVVSEVKTLAHEAGYLKGKMESSHLP